MWVHTTTHRVFYYIGYYIYDDGKYLSGDRSIYDKDRTSVAAEDGEQGEGHLGEQLGQDVVLDELDMGD